MQQEYHNKEESVTKVDRSLAKKSQALLLSTFMPDKMSYAAAAKLTGVNRSSIKRGRDGESLIGAETLAKILVEHFNLKGYARIKDLIKDDVNLNLYFENELGEKYSEYSSTPDQISYQLSKAINCPLSKKLYGLIWSYKTVDISILKKSYSHEELSRVLKRMENNNIIKIHHSLGLIVFNNEYETDCLYFNTQQIKIAALNIDPESIQNSESMYYQDTVLLSKKNEQEFYDLLLKQKTELSLFIKKCEDEDNLASEKSELVEVVSFYNKLNTITSEKEGLLQ